MLRTTIYVHPLQQDVSQYAQRIWDYALAVNLPESNLKPFGLITDPAPMIPQIIHIPNVINGYNRNPGHFSPADNLIIGYMAFNGAGSLMWQRFIIHELTHWLQHRLSNYKPTRDTHTHVSWSDACWLVGLTLGFDKPREFYRANKSARNEAGKVIKVQNPGSLSTKELHHFPDCIPAEYFAPNS